MLKYKMLLISLISLFVLSCSPKENEAPSIKSTERSDLWVNYTKDTTTFRIWSPEAEKVQLHLYKEGNGGEAFATHEMEYNNESTWSVAISGDLNGTYYTYQIMYKGEWLGETPGIYAQAVGVNEKRAMVVNMSTTNPVGWETDKGPKVKAPNEAIIYELHVRDLTMHPESGSGFPGKYLGLVEEGTRGPEGVKTGIDHMKELGITHVHLAPRI